MEDFINRAYTKVIQKPETLNKYQAWSPMTYGEISFKFVCQMMNMIDISSTDVFIDIGLGVGNVVLQMAGYAEMKKCIGIEYVPLRIEHALGIQNEFERQIKTHSKRANLCEFIEGDFMTDEHLEIVKTGTIFFINNLMFEAETNQWLQTVFQEFPNETKIFSTKRFCPRIHAINGR